MRWVFEYPSSRDFELTVLSGHSKHILIYIARSSVRSHRAYTRGDNRSALDILIRLLLRTEDLHYA